MSNSPLATYTRLTNDCNKPRNHAIDTITIHCMAGQMTGRACADYFAETTRQVSSNYCVGYDGDIAVSVNECDRSWCSSSGANDHRAITIEVATDKTPPYKCTDKAYAALLDLVTDCCKRNGIKKLNYTGDKSGNMTLHQWFTATACPGEYLKGKLTAIQDEVNRRLGAESKKRKLYRVQIGAFSKKVNAENLAKEAQKKGFQTVVKFENKFWRVQTGAYSVKANAETAQVKLQKAGFDAIIKEVAV